MAARRSAGLALLLPFVLLGCTSVATAARHVLEQGRQLSYDDPDGYVKRAALR
jgi:hypothetical protein